MNRVVFVGRREGNFRSAVHASAVGASLCCIVACHHASVVAAVPKGTINKVKRDQWGSKETGTPAPVLAGTGHSQIQNRPLSRLDARPPDDLICYAEELGFGLVHLSIVTGIYFAPELADCDPVFLSLWR